MSIQLVETFNLNGVYARVEGGRQPVEIRYRAPEHFPARRDTIGRHLDAYTIPARYELVVNGRRRDLNPNYRRVTEAALWWAARRPYREA